MRLLLTGCLLLGAAAAPAAEKARVLSREAYFRQYVQFGLMPIAGALLEEQGEKLFDKRGLVRLRRHVRRLLKHRDIDWDATDWRDVACYHFASTQTADDTAAVQMLPEVPPPDDWMQATFDDHAWLRQRLGILNPVTPQFGAARERYSLHRRALFLRTYFHVPDPAKAGDLTVTLTYRGGVRAFVNGTEIGRGHLPDGPLDPHTMAETYPAEAYKGTAEETPDRCKAGFIGDLRCSFDRAPATFRFTGKYREAYGAISGVTRQGWNRLRGLRDRTLGPITIPAKLLRPGGNVLALELRTAPYHPMVIPGAGGRKARNWGAGGANGNVIWDHVRLVDIDLRSAPGGAVSAVRRPPGAQAWVEDMHARMFNRDYSPAGAPTGTARVVAAQNGTFSVQIGIGTDRELTGLNAACGDLTGPNGARIPAGAARVFYLRGHSVGNMAELGWFRCLGRGGFAPMAHVAMWRYCRNGDIWHGFLRGITRKKYRDGPTYRKMLNLAKAKFFDQFLYFDHLAAEPPETVPADSCQPLWLSLQVPADARPGTYRGAVTISADRIRRIQVPLEAEVIAWRVPDPLEFQTLVESEQSPYGVGRAYKTELWSDEHWRVVETSFRQLARLGSDWVFVPVLLESELGNRADSPIRWIRRKDGSLAFDFRRMDRYLDLAVKHLGVPRVICFLVMHGCGSKTNDVLIHNEATGKAERVDVGPKTEIDRRPLWRGFATALYAHMQERGLAQSMFWGHAFDRTYDPLLIPMLREFTPTVYWAAGAHGRKPGPTFRAVARTYGSDLTPMSLKGWKNPYVHLLMPRTGGSIICVEGTSTPFTWRVMCDRALHSGMNGLGRMGADYFDGTWMDGFKGGEWLLVGRACVQTLWPGTDGVESSARNEAMLQGIQEAEARIFLEQVLERNVLPRETAAEMQNVLDDHFRATLHIAAGGIDYATMDYHVGWQDRSRKLFGAAARAARVVGMDVAPARIGDREIRVVQKGRETRGYARKGVPVPLLGRRTVTVTLRNWTARPRKWTASADIPWIRPEKTSGTVSRHEALAVVLDGAGHEVGDTVKGVLTVTDAAGGTSMPVEITTAIEKGFEFPDRLDAFNAAPGEQDVKRFVLRNRTASEQAWTLTSSADFLKADPASGKLAAGEAAVIKATARPGDKKAATVSGTLTLSAAGGAIHDKVPVRLYVIPPYREPAEPEGESVPLQDVHRDRLQSYRQLGYKGGDRKAPWWARGLHFHRRIPMGEDLKRGGFDKKSGGPAEKWSTIPFGIGPPDAEKRFRRGLWVYPRAEVVYKLDGAGFRAFAASVGFHKFFPRNRMANEQAAVNFEVYVDGELATQSGLMRPGDRARRLVATGLEHAKELKLLVRRDNDRNDSYCLATWANPRLYKTRREGR
jgi:hypothetical protein